METHWPDGGGATSVAAGAGGAYEYAGAGAGYEYAWACAWGGGGGSGTDGGVQLGSGPAAWGPCANAAVPTVVTAANRTPINVFFTMSLLSRA